MSGIRKLWKRLTERSKETEHSTNGESSPDTENSPDWMESIWWFINHPSVGAEHKRTRKEIHEMARRNKGIRERLTPEQYVNWHATVHVGKGRRSSNLPPLGAEELFKIAKKNMLHPKGWPGLLRLAEKQPKMDAAELRAVEEEARRLHLQDRPRLDAEIEEWVAGFDREKLKQEVSKSLDSRRENQDRQSKIYSKVYSMQMNAKFLLSEFDSAIALYDPMGHLYWLVGSGVDPAGVHAHALALTLGSTGKATKSKFLKEAHKRAYEEDADWFSVEFKRAIHNDEYIVKGRLRKMKELYRQAMEDLGIRPSVEPYEELRKIANKKIHELLKQEEQKKPDKAAVRVAEEEGRRLALQDRSRLDAEIRNWAANIDRGELKQWVNEDLEMWKSRQRWREKDVVDMKEIAKDMIESEFDNTIKEYGIWGELGTIIGGADNPDWRVETRGGLLAMEARHSSPLLRAACDGDQSVDWDSSEFKRECDNDDYVIEGRLRKMKELYVQVIAEMDFMEVQAPTDRPIDLVRAAFLSELESIEEDIGIDFFIFEEREDGRILVKGKGYLDRDIWGALNDMVRRELDGRYDPSERGWVIEK